MAQTKSIKAKTSARSTKKQPKSGLARRFDLSNRRVRFFSVIALIAVLGGGFFLVRSFAAIENYGAQSTATVANGKLRPWNGATIVTDAAKNNLRVIRVRYGQAAGTTGLTLTAPRGYKLQYCATVRADRAGTFGASTGMKNNMGSAWDIKATTQWSESCSSVSMPWSTDTNLDISVFNSNQNTIYVSQVYIKKVESPAK